jgi:hypothetical protein
VPFGWLRDECPYMWLHCEKRRHHSSNNLGYEELQKLSLVLDFGYMDNWTCIRFVFFKLLLMPAVAVQSSSIYDLQMVLCFALLGWYVHAQVRSSFDPSGPHASSMSTNQRSTQQVGMVLIPCMVVAKEY